MEVTSGSLEKHLHAKDLSVYEFVYSKFEMLHSK